jgi:CheY-like chemotaxis protein
LQLVTLQKALPAASGGTIPAIALTAYSTKRDREISQLFGFQMLLAKPIEPTQLVADVAKLIGT